MQLIILILCIIALSILLQKGGTLHTFFTSKKNSNFVKVIGGIFAWCATGFFFWGVWRMALFVIDAMSGQFHYLPVIQLAAIMMGIATLYQMLTNSFFDNSTDKIFTTFFQLLLFRTPFLRREDIFEKADQLIINKALEDEKTKSPDTDVEKYFGK